jgi:hypothetical protein
MHTSSRPGRSFLDRFGATILRGGIAPVPATLYFYQAELGLSPQEVWFIGYILAHKWDEDLPHPSLVKMAERVGLSSRQLHRIKGSLTAKGLLTCVPRRQAAGGKDSNGYDFSDLFGRLESLIRAHGPRGERPVEEPPLFGDEESPPPLSHRDGTPTSHDSEATYPEPERAETKHVDIPPPSPSNFPAVQDRSEEEVAFFNQATWRAAQAILRLACGPDEYERIARYVQLLEIDQARGWALLGVPNAHLREEVQARLTVPIQTALERACGSRLKLLVVVRSPKATPRLAELLTAATGRDGVHTTSDHDTPVEQVGSRNMFAAHQPAVVNEEGIIQ